MLAASACGEYEAGPVPLAGGEPRVDAVYAAYRSFCEDSGVKTPVTKERLGQQMRFFFPEAERRRVLAGGTRIYVYAGLPRAEATG